MNLSLYMILMLAFLFSFSFLNSRGALAPAEDPAARERQALRIGREYIAAHYSFFDRQGSQPVIDDLGGSWQVTYELPRNPAGGAPVVIINKRTLRVMGSYQAQ